MKKLFLFLFVTAAMWQCALAAGDTLDDPGNNRILWVQNFEGLVRDCAFMPDEDYIINAVGGKLQVRKTIDQSLVREKDFSPSVIYSLDVSKDGKYVVIGGAGGSMRLLDINTFEVLKDLKIQTALEVNFSPDGKKVTCVSGKKAYVVDIETNETIFSYGLDSGSSSIVMSHAVFSPDGKWLACNYRGGGDPRIFVFDTETWQLYYGFNNDIISTASGAAFFFTPDSRYLIYEGGGFSFRVWDINLKLEVANYGKEYINPLVVFNDNKTLLLTNYAKLTAVFFDISLNKIIKEIPVGLFGGLNSTLNKNETLLLGDKLNLTQIDKSILSVEPEGRNENDKLLIPNPATNEVLIRSILPFNDNVEVNITDISGKYEQKIYSQFANEGAFEFRYNISHLATGSYFFRLSQRNFTQTFKLIKEGR